MVAAVERLEVEEVTAEAVEEVADTKAVAEEDAAAIPVITPP